MANVGRKIKKDTNLYFCSFSILSFAFAKQSCAQALTFVVHEVIVLGALLHTNYFPSSESEQDAQQHEVSISRKKFSVLNGSKISIKIKVRKDFFNSVFINIEKSNPTLQVRESNCPLLKKFNAREKQLLNFGKTTRTKRLYLSQTRKKEYCQAHVACFSNKIFRLAFFFLR